MRAVPVARRLALSLSAAKGPCEAPASGGGLEGRLLTPELSLELELELEVELELGLEGAAGLALAGVVIGLTI
jgi:hypothetical protein